MPWLDIFHVLYICIDSLSWLISDYLLSLMQDFRQLRPSWQMVLDSLSSPHRRSQNTVFLASPSKKQQSGFNEPGSWSTIYERHRFLLMMLALLAFLCTIYLYFAVTLGATGSCSGMSGAEKALCQAKSSLHKGKLKFFWPASGLEHLEKQCLWD